MVLREFEAKKLEQTGLVIYIWKSSMNTVLFVNATIVFSENLILVNNLI